MGLVHYLTLTLLNCLGCPELCCIDAIIQAQFMLRAHEQFSIRAFIERLLEILAPWKESAFCHILFIRLDLYLNCHKGVNSIRIL